MSDPTPVKRGFARQLRELMDQKGLSQSDLARAVWGQTTDRRGYTVARNRDRVSAYLRGSAVPKPETMALLAGVLGTTVAELAPDLTASAVERAHPAISLIMYAGHADETLLQVDMSVPLSVAAQIVALLATEVEKGCSP